MITYCNTNFSDDIEPCGSLASQLFSGIIYFFQDQDFGPGLNQIIFLMMSGNEDHVRYHGIGRSYSKRKKSYGSLFLVDYKVIVHMNKQQLFNFFAKALIDEANCMRDYKISDFDINKYIEQLNVYFQEAIPIAMEGRFPSEGKILNKEVEEEMNRKFSRL